MEHKLKPTECPQGAQCDTLALHTKVLNNSINQSTNQSINESINHSINRSIN